MSNHNQSFLNNKVITRGPKEGYCKICKQYGTLTRDHIPPKGSIQISPVELRTLMQDENIPSTISQDGTNFRTICSYCNSTLLGTEYDPELNKISTRIGDLIKSANRSGIYLPAQVSIKVKPQRLARAVIGHLLASNYHPEAKDLENPALRKYFLDKNATLPKEIDIYYWFYPSNRQVLVHLAAISFFKAPRRSILSSFMKFFPIAYWIAWEKPQHTGIAHSTLFQDRTIGIDDSEEIQIKLSNYPRLDFPEVPYDDDGYILMYNSQLTSVATRKKRKKNKGFDRKN